MGKKQGRTKSHFVRTKLIVEIEKLRNDGKTYKEISKIISVRFKKHFSVGLIHTIFNGGKK